jgi:hypothetical protein
MGYFSCRNSPHADCNGYIGPLDTFACPCTCHVYGEDGRRIITPPPGPSGVSAGTGDGG